MRNTLAALFAVLLLAGPGAPTGWAQSAGHTIVKADELTWVNVSALPPGARGAILEGPLDQPGPFTLRVTLPANYEIPPHWHPAIEHVTVLSGTFNLGFGDALDRSTTTALPVGAVAILQPKTHHFAWTAEETLLQIHGMGPWDITYVDPADDPRKTTARGDQESGESPQRSQ
jgi:hypothetical protein